MLFSCASTAKTGFVGDDLCSLPYKEVASEVAKIKAPQTFVLFFFFENVTCVLICIVVHANSLSLH